ncbi:MAG: fluoride efflux transporter CrcB [Ferruginibacter sp.]
MLKNILLVALGGSAGSVLRYLCNIAVKNHPFPYATLAINIIGSFLIGIILAWASRNEDTEAMRLLFATGICGGFTTFSAFSYENIMLIQAGKLNLALLYILLSVTAGIAAAWLGYKLINT